MNTWIYSDSKPIEQRLRSWLTAAEVELTASRCVNISDLSNLRDVEPLGADLAFVVALRIDAKHLELVKRLRQRAHEGAKIVVVATCDDHGLVLQAVRAGASDFVIFNDKLEDELQSLMQRIQAEKCSSENSEVVFAVAPSRSASDASFLAVNLAACLAKRTGSCGLLDFQFRGGSLAGLLKVDPRHTVVDLLSQQGAIDEAVFEQALAIHESGIRLLAGPSALSDLKIVQPQLCQQIVDLARCTQSQVVVNTEDLQHAEQVRVLASSNDLVVTMRLDVPSLETTRQMVDFLIRNQIPKAKIHVVAMGAGQVGELTPSTVQKILGIESFHLLPHDPVATLCSVNLGNPAVIEAPNSKVSRGIERFVMGITGGKTVPTTPSMLGNLKSTATMALGKFR